MPTAAGSKRRVLALARAARSPFTCLCRRRRANRKLLPMSNDEQQTPRVVLVVDDEVQIRRFLRAGFELDGFTVQEAETGEQALRLATLNAPDLVILDLGLPDMDGADVLERLRAWSSVPLIVLSVRAKEAEKVP